MSGQFPEDLLTLMDWVLKSTLADIAIAWADFFAGKALYDSWMREE